MTQERREKFQTSSGIELPTEFSPNNTNIDYENDIGDAGAFPYTRGVRKSSG